MDNLFSVICFLKVLHWITDMGRADSSRYYQDIWYVVTLSLCLHNSSMWLDGDAEVLRKEHWKHEKIIWLPMYSPHSPSWQIISWTHTGLIKVSTKTMVHLKKERKNFYHSILRKSFILINLNLLRIYYVQGIMLDATLTLVNKTRMVSAFIELNIWR